MNIEESLEPPLRKLARIQVSRPFLILTLVLAGTAITLHAAQDLQMRTDLQEELPQDLRSIQLEETVSSKLGGTDVMLIVVRLNHSSSVQAAPDDIRDPAVMTSLLQLESRLETDPRIESVSSPASLFTATGVPATLSGVKTVLSQFPQTDPLFNPGYSATLVRLYVTIPGEEQKINAFIADLKDDIHAVQQPAGVSMTVTGEAAYRATLTSLLREEMIFSMLVASLLILGFLVLVQRSIARAFLIFSPLVFAVIWTLGTMALLGIPVTIATVFIGALILGMGIEFGGFMVERYKEELSDDYSYEEAHQALVTAVPSVGTAIVGSSSTTILGFLTLLAATMPMIRELGVALALGITYSLLAVIFFDPVLIIAHEWSKEVRPW